MRMVKEGQMLCFALFLLCLIGGGGIQRGEAYKNYTVGDSLGWFDNLEKPSVDYDKWVSGMTFSLGDFLLFNTDSNHSVTQTHNFTTYSTCDSQGDDNIQWSSIDPNSTEVLPVTVPVPLLKEGPTYFFSGDYDGEQCMHGQKFEINVTHGQGLPPSLRDDPDLATGPTTADAAPGPNNPDAGDDSTPDTISSNYDFSHPKKVPSDDSTSDDEEDGAKTKSNEASFVGFREVFLVGLISGVLGLLV